MSRGKVLLIVVPAAVLVGVLVTLLFLSSLSEDRDSFGNPQEPAAAASQSYWTGQGAASASATAPSAPLSSAPPASAAPSSSLPLSSSAAPPSDGSSTAPGGQAPTGLPTPGGFSEAPTVSVNGSTVSVTFKTTANSTVNSVLVSSGEGMDVGAFYDYYNRDAEYSPAVEKKASFNVGPEGVTETYELPDLSKSYWLLINTVDNETEEWQGSVTVVPVYVA